MRAGISFLARCSGIHQPRLALPAEQAVAENAKAGTTCRCEIPEAERLSSLPGENRSPSSARDPAEAYRGDEESARGACHSWAGLVAAPPGGAERGSVDTISVQMLPASSVTQGRA